MEATEDAEAKERETLFGRLLKSAYQLVPFITRDPDLGDDLVQDGALATLVEMETYPERLITEEERERFMNTVMRNMNANVFKHQKVHKRLQDEIGRKQDANQSAVWQPDRAYDRKCLNDLIEGVLSELKTHYKGILEMRYYERMKPAEIAAATGVPIELLRTHLSRALGRMKRSKELEAYFKLWVTET